MKQIFEDSQGWPTEAVEKSRTGMPVEVEVQVGKLTRTQEISLELSADLRFTGSVFEIDLKIIGPKSVEIENPEVEDEMMTVLVDGSKAQLESEGAGAYGAFRGIRFREGNMEFALKSAKAVVKNGKLEIYEGVIGAP